jgi:hypothetical protein
MFFLLSFFNKNSITTSFSPKKSDSSLLNSTFFQNKTFFVHKMKGKVVYLSSFDITMLSIFKVEIF